MGEYLDTKEVRCNTKGRLYFKITNNLIQVKCRDCGKMNSEKLGYKVAVFHSYDLAGNLVETVLKKEE